MAASTNPAVTVFAWGNDYRGDDAIGTILASRIQELNLPEIDLIEDHQLNLEHVMDIREEVPVLFIDASVAIDADYALERLRPEGDGSVSSHSISPQALLALYERTLGKPAPCGYLLHVCGSSFELGDSISAATARSVDRAWTFLADVFSGPRNQWGARLDAASSVL